MSSIIRSIRNYFKPAQPIQPGIYHYQAPQQDPRNYRLHLRIEPDGSGVLIVNAATVLHLNQTAAEFAYYLVQGFSTDEAVQAFAQRYQVDQVVARQDYQYLIDRLDSLVSAVDLDPVSYLDFERQTPFSGELSAPYRLDCALTYQLPSGEAPESAPVKRVGRELTTAEWKSVLDKAWQAGIPQVVFTGGEPTLREDLVELIAHAEANGQVSGLLTNGLHLAEKLYLNDLLQTGLDHLLLVFDPENDLAWTALHNVIDVDLFVSVHLTVTAANQDRLTGILDRIARIEVPAVSLSAASPDLAHAMQAASDHAAMLDLELVWNLPVPYSATNPIALELENHEQAEAAGKAWLYVEPDGDVLPGQGVYQVLGNFLNDSWQKIWEAARAR
jgi:Radical SAM superfamily/Coenzyme PQQ synthesis protein D (PqqD)